MANIVLNDAWFTFCQLNLFVLIFKPLMTVEAACDFLWCPKAYFLKQPLGVENIMFLNVSYDESLSSTDFSSSFGTVHLFFCCTKLISGLNFIQFSWFLFPTFLLIQKNRLYLSYIEYLYPPLQSYFYPTFKDVFTWVKMIYRSLKNSIN